ncbi:hypothetical protein GSI_11445 [Ganoderma sinense ZZ0214-1]|uniref:Uncharacterized protein n=1 Tax=Ganoderma sinense ZZ0214-1 TaxID=1077348 RepID=A0A2G8RW02_9APHY|nr:hypothetical protein GSI_11445 [Ganoderma sinense ZZ0214-1]
MVVLVMMRFVVVRIPTRLLRLLLSGRWRRSIPTVIISWRGGRSGGRRWLVRIVVLRRRRGGIVVLLVLWMMCVRIVCCRLCWRRSPGMRWSRGRCGSRCWCGSGRWTVLILLGRRWGRWMVSVLLVLMRWRRRDAVMMGRRRVMRGWRRRSGVCMGIVMVRGCRSSGRRCRVTMIIWGWGWRRGGRVVRMLNWCGSMWWTRRRALGGCRRMLWSECRINRSPANVRVRRTRFVDARIIPRSFDPATFLALSPGNRPARTRACDTPGRFSPIPVALSVTIPVPFALPFTLLALQLFLLVIILLVIV